MTDSIKIGAEARRLLTCADDGMLSTPSVEVPGYPFGSVLPDTLDRSGRAVILNRRLCPAQQEHPCRSPSLPHRAGLMAHFTIIHLHAALGRDE